MTPTGTLDPRRAKTAGRPSRNSRAGRGLAVVAAVALVISACGGSSKKSNATSATTDTSIGGTTSTVAGDTATTAAGETSTTVVGGTVTTAKTATGQSSTAKSSTAKSSTAKNSTATTQRNTTLTTTGSNRTTTTAVGETPQPGGTLTIIKSLDSGAGWDPLNLTVIGSLTATIVNTAIYDSLFTEDPATFQMLPRIGTSITTSDGTTWTLKLRPNVKFSDGTPYDAAAVKFNWQRIGVPANNAVARSTVQSIQAMNVVDPVTLQIVLAAPNLNFSHLVAQQINWIGSPTAIQAQGSDFGTHPIGAGPFIFESWARQSQLTMVRNPNYWNAPLPYLDRVVIKIVPDGTQAYNTMKAGQGDAVQMTDPVVMGRAQADGYNLLTTSGNDGGFAVIFNNSKPPFNNPIARKAMDLAIDRNQFITLRRDGNPIWMMTALSKSTSPFYDPTLAPAKADLTQAQKLVDQYVQQTGGPLKFALTTFDNAAFSADAQVLQAMMNKLNNVQVTLDIKGPLQAIQARSSGDFQALSQDVSSNVPGIDMQRDFMSTSTENYARYNSADADAAFAELRGTSDQAKQIALVHRIQKDILNDSGVAWFMQYITATASSTKVHGLQTYYREMNNLDTVWVSK